MRMYRYRIESDQLVIERLKEEWTREVIFKFTSLTKEWKDIFRLRVFAKGSRNEYTICVAVAMDELEERGLI